jgi:hypothetical protein
MTNATARSTRNTSILDRLWIDLPAEREALRPYIERSKSLRNDCGCAMGGGFLTGALLIVILDGLFFHRITGRGLLNSGLRGTALAFGASVAGKVIGIGVARLRLGMKVYFFPSSAASSPLSCSARPGMSGTEAMRSTQCGRARARSRPPYAGCRRCSKHVLLIV